MVAGGEPAWVTVPVNRSFHGTREIREIEIDDARPWREKMLRTLEQSYARAPCFGEVFPLISELISNPAGRIAEHNEASIRVLSELLGLDPGRMLLSSDLDVDGAATERLIRLVQAAGGDTYLAGGGAEGYQEDDAFAAAGIELIPQNFEHPVYAQGAGEFVSGLSVVDALMHQGPAEAGRQLTRS